VLAINTDDPARGRAVFNEHGYTMKLLFDDRGLADRYGVTALPYTVILDREGRVREVVRGTGRDLAALVDAAGGSKPSGGSPAMPSGGSPATPSGGSPAMPSGGSPATPSGGSPATPSAGPASTPSAGPPSTPSAGKPAGASE
jgi:hypothetical protein